VDVFSNFIFQMQILTKKYLHKNIYIFLKTQKYLYFSKIFLLNFFHTFCLSMNQNYNEKTVFIPKTIYWQKLFILFFDMLRFQAQVSSNIRILSPTLFNFCATFHRIRFVYSINVYPIKSIKSKSYNSINIFQAKIYEKISTFSCV